MDAESIRKQSEAAYKQWSKQWREHAIEHKKYAQVPMSKFENIGIGKAVLCVANGYSFEEEIETIKANQHNVDILCCDKTLGNLLDNGVIPTYCMVCDANVDYEKYMDKWKDKLSQTTLFINVCGNPKWTKNGNWKEIVFFVNKDILGSHHEFAQLSGCVNSIPAGTNVSNAMVILLTQSDNGAKRNVFGYDKIILIGFDYSWKYNGKYYAFDKSANGKEKYMRHFYITSPAGNELYTSGNLAFSREWLQTYIRTFDVPVVQCGKDSILHCGKVATLESQMQYRHKPEDGATVKKLVKELQMLGARLGQIQNNLNSIGREHSRAHLYSI